MSVLVIMADAIPCKNRMTIRSVELGTNAHKKVVKAKKMVPYKNILVLPQVSPSFPNGTRNMTDASRYDMETQLNPTADIEKSVPIFFSATLTAAPINGLKKWVAMVATSKKVLFTPLSAVVFDFIIIRNK